MKVKVFEKNHNGKVEFTLAELEKLLNDVYTEAYREGEAKANSSYWYWNSPILHNCGDGYSNSTSSPTVSIDKINTCSTDDTTETACECANPERRAYTITNIDPETAKKVSKRVDEIIKNATDNGLLAKFVKELDF